MMPTTLVWTAKFQRLRGDKKPVPKKSPTEVIAISFLKINAT